MKGSNWLSRRRWLITALVVIGLVVVLKPVLWPGGFGFREGQASTITTEKDPQGNVTKTVETVTAQPGKTLWDLLSLLGVPISVALLGAWLQHLQQKRSEEQAATEKQRVEEQARLENKRAEERAETERRRAEEQAAIAAAQQREELLQAYFDRLSVLLIDKTLLAVAAHIQRVEKNVGPGLPPLREREGLTSLSSHYELIDPASDVIRARTLSILRSLSGDGKRKGSVVRFLVETGIIDGLELDLNDADLSNADLSSVELSSVNLIGANLENAFLVYANLAGAKLIGATLKGAILAEINLSGSFLTKADLIDSTLIKAVMTGADLEFASLSSANLMGATLISANLFAANLISANLFGANLMSAKLCSAKLNNAILTCATLDHADLSGANLSSANLTGSSISGIIWDSETTVWPSKEAFVEVQGISEALKQHLGIEAEGTPS